MLALSDAAQVAVITTLGGLVLALLGGGPWIAYHSARRARAEASNAAVSSVDTHDDKVFARMIAVVDRLEADNERMATRMNQCEAAAESARIETVACRERERGLLARIEALEAK